MAKCKKGFTLAEVLIVVVIIAVLVAVSIPIFTSQLEKAREAVDLSNVRSAYSILQTSITTETFPDGENLNSTGGFFVFTSSGTFKRHSPGNLVDVTNAYKLKSKNADLSSFIDMNWSEPDETTGWKDYVIVIFYPSDEPIMYVCPQTWIT